MILTKEYLRERFVYLDGALHWKRDKTKSVQWNARFVDKIAGSVRADKRRVIRLDGELYLAYHLIWIYHHNILSNEIDHKDRDCSNDRIENLRVADRFINNQNSTALGTVRMANGKYIARVFEYGKMRHLGTFDTQLEAHAAYENARG